MIEGLHYLPAVQAHRDKLADEGNHYSREFLECEACRASTDEAARRAMHCGWMPESRWLDIVGGRPIPEARTCPGYTIRLADVYEAARAYAWSQRGELGLLYDDPPTPLLRTCVDLVSIGAGQAQRDALRAQQREAMIHRG